MKDNIDRLQLIDPASFKRRDFLQISGLSATALALGIMPGCDEPLTVVNLTIFSSPSTDGLRLNPFVFIDPSGKVTLVAHRPDSGNGTYNAMPMLLAEELEVDIDNVEYIPASANHKLYGGQFTSASYAVRGSWLPSRKIGAAAREVLITSAAQKWGVEREECYAHERSRHS